MGIVARQPECICQVKELQRCLLTVRMRGEPPS